MAAFNIPKREKILFVIVLVVVSLWVWIQFIVHPILNNGAELDAAIAAKNLRLREAKKLLASTAQSEGTETLLKRFSSEGSTQEAMARMIKDIESAAGQSGLKVLETKPQPQINNSGWYELRVSISFEGRWPDAVKFFYELENFAKPLFVNELFLEVSMPQQTTIRGRLDIVRFVTGKPSDQ